MKSSTLPYWLALLVGFAAAYGLWTWRRVTQFERQRAEGGVLVHDGPPLQSFELVERSGQNFRSDQMRGRVWAASFFFSTCPGSCTRLNANIRYLHNLDELRDVTWVSISVDPDHDTLPVLREYADRLQADPRRWLFCRGDMGYVRRVARDVLQLDDVSYKGHRDYAVVIDKRGKVRGVFDATSHSQSERLRQLLIACLAEPAPAGSPGGSPPPAPSAADSLHST